MSKSMRPVVYKGNPKTAARKSAEPVSMSFPLRRPFPISERATGRRFAGLQEDDMEQSCP